jgi:hypothetical protein
MKMSPKSPIMAFMAISATERKQQLNRRKDQHNKLLEQYYNGLCKANKNVRK